MRLNRRQLRRLIESAIYEQAEDQSKTGESQNRQDQPALTRSKLEDHAQAINACIRGTIDTDTSEIGSIKQALDQFGLDINGTDEDGLVRIFQSLMKKGSGFEGHWTDYLDDINQRYRELFGRDMKKDLNTDLNDADINMIERKCGGFRDYLGRGRM